MSKLTFVKKMINGIGGFDTIILVAAVIELIIFFVILHANSSLKKEINEKDISFRELGKDRKILRWLCSIFITVITIFPLLGMFGTVISLLNLEINTSNADQMLNVQSSFWDALTSTAWGIVFSIVFKLCWAWISSDISDNIIAVDKKLAEENVENGR